MYEKVVCLRFTDLVLNLNYYLKTIYLLGGYIIKERFQRISGSRLWDRCNVYIFFYRNSESSVNISYLNIRPSQEHIGFPFCFKLAVLCSLGVDKLFEVQSGWLFWVSCSTNSGRGRHCWTRTCGRSKGTCSETTEIYKISTHISFLLRIVRPPTPRGNWRRDQLLTYHRKNKFKMISEI